MKMFEKFLKVNLVNLHGNTSVDELYFYICIFFMIFVCTATEKCIALTRTKNEKIVFSDQIEYLVRAKFMTAPVRTLSIVVFVQKRFYKKKI